MVRVKRLFKKRLSGKAIVALCCVVAVCLCFVCCWLVLDDRQSDFEVEASEPVIIEVWHIETFEGGSSSRYTYLKNMAIKLKQQNSNYNVLVVQLTPEQLEIQLSKGLYPTAISYGVGVGELLRESLLSLPDDLGVLDCFLDAGQYSGNQLAVAYASGFYSLIAREDYLIESGVFSADELIAVQEEDGFVVDDDFASKLISNINGLGFSSSGKTRSSIVVGASGYTDATKSLDVGIESVDNTLSAYDAYCNYISGAATLLLGTTRDVVRLNAKEELGKMPNLFYCPLYDYTDLVQYYSIFDGISLAQEDCAIEFMQMLLSGVGQECVEGIGLYSTTDFTAEYADISVANVFSSCSG